MPRFIFALLLSLLLSATESSGENWNRFRGPDGTGVSSAKNLPVKWDASNIRWRTDLKAGGQSSPISWEDKIFLTTATKSDKGIVRDLVCLDKKTGKINWRQTCSVGSAESLHSMNTWASATCATDGQRVVAFFGIGGIHCYSIDGKKIWSKDLGEFVSPWGVAASPIILGDMVIQNCDSDEEAYITALDKNTGKEIWKTDRFNIRGWSTPLLIKTPQREELVMNGDHGIQSYNPKTGEEYWLCKSFIGRGSPLPAVGEDNMLYVLNGKPGPIYAVKPGGKGDVTKTHMVWNTKRTGGRDLPSPVWVDGFLFVVNMKGIASCYDPKTGEELWRDRLGSNHTFSAATTSANGLIYANDEAGNTFVIKPGKKMDIVATNSMGDRDDEIFRSALLPGDGVLYIRSNQALYCVGQ